MSVGRETDTPEGAATAALQPVDQLPDPVTGELAYPAVPQQAARLWRLVGDMIDRLYNLRNDFYVPVLAAEAQRIGSKTLHLDDYDVTLTGGEYTEYDPYDLMENLAKAGCPEESINATVVAEVKYRVNRKRLTSLAAANPAYKMAIEAAATKVVKPWRASIR